MGHLAPEALLDIAEGVQPAASAPHLDVCEPCRARVAELRRTLQAVAAVDVPEPSPLFWDHLSARVREAVAAEPTVTQSGWWPEWASWRLMAAMSAAVVLLAAGLAIRGGSTVPDAPAVSASGPALGAAADIADAAVGDGVGDIGGALQDDVSLNLLADLASDLDWDDVAEAGIVVRAGATDLALTDLSETEREELRRLLTEELSGQTL